MSELLPCPFCGGDRLTMTTDVGTWTHSVLCRDCGGRSGCYHDSDEARRRWNERPPAWAVSTATWAERVRSVIVSRYRAGEPVEDLAQDYDAPLDVVRRVVAS